ncbi:MAG: hypothetical protein ACXW3U_15750 [Rhodoplanes sp.]
MIGDAELQLRLQRLRVPGGNEGWQHGLVTAGRNAKKIDDRNSVLECFAKPSIVGCVGVFAHERVVDRLVGGKYLLMHPALVIVPDSVARLRKHGLNRQQKPHLLGLNDAAPRIDERDALPIEKESQVQAGRSQGIVHLAQPSDVLEGCYAHEDITIVISWLRHWSPFEAMLVVPA